MSGVHRMPENPPVRRGHHPFMEPGIFELRQIKRAVELGIGVRAASAIDLIPADDASAGLSAALGTILSRG